MVGSEVFLMKQKHQFIYPNEENELVSPVIKKIEIIMWIRVYPIWNMNFNSKSGRKKSFLMKPKHQYHLFQSGECVCGAQSQKEKRLLH